MKLTKAEVRKIEQGMAVLKEKLAGQLKEQTGEKLEKIDSAFVKKIAKTYLTVEGFAQLLQDYGIVSDKQRCSCDSPCQVSCAEPCKNSCYTAPSNFVAQSPA